MAVLQGTDIYGKRYYSDELARIPTFSTANPDDLIGGNQVTHHAVWSILTGLLAVTESLQG